VTSFQQQSIAVSILCPVSPEKASALVAYLEALNCDIHSSNIESLPLFQQVQSHHFCRWVVIPATKGKHGNYAPQLLFESNIDEPLSDYLHQLVQQDKNTLNEIYQHCVDFNPSELEHYLIDHAHSAAVYYRGAHYHSRDQIELDDILQQQFHQALVMRMLSSLSRVDQNRVRSGKLDDDDWAKLTSSMSLLSEARLFIDDTPALSPTELRARARRIKREHDLDLVVIDYLQLMQVAGSSENRTNEISEISRGLKTLAKELRVPVIALSQLNRSLEQRTDKRPIMSDLRESGAIEQDADVISFVYREEVYNKDDPDLKGRAEIIIGKQRNGPIGVIPLTFNGMYTRFDNYAGEQDYYDGGHE